jgi:hypothetical protein
MQPKRHLVIAASALAVLIVAVPALAANPLSSRVAPEPAEVSGAAPSKSPKPGKPDKGPETPVTVSGTLTKSVDVKGRPTYALSANGKTWTISAGPHWFLGDDNPLEAYVGTSVTVVGTTRGDGAELDAETVDGTALREGGRPAWAGGPWHVGQAHPGWKEWMADGKPGKGRGREDAPGQQKQSGD